MRILSIFCAAAVGLLGCAKNDLPDYNVLGGLRVLAMKAAAPEVAPGDTTTVTPVVSDIAGAGRELTYVAVGCPDPGVSLGAKPSCLGNPMRVELGGGSFTPTAPSFTQVAPAFTVAVPVALLEMRSTLDQFNGVAYLMTYDISTSSGESVSAYKRLIVSDAVSRPVKNSNPTLSGVLAGGGGLTALPAAKTALKVDAALTSGVESYDVLTSSGGSKTLQETLITTWFLSDGTVNHFRTVGADEVSYTPPEVLPTAHSVVLVAVIRDGRGGEDYWMASF
ncbi:hypothetical protein WDW86_05840 [Bdellovibrionota bacterium FG-2]